MEVVPFLPIHWICVGFAALMAGLVVGLVLNSKATKKVVPLAQQVALLGAQLSDAKARLEATENTRDELLHRAQEWENHATMLQTTLELEQVKAAEKEALLERAEIKLTETFKSLSVDALRGSQEVFLQLANSRLEKQQLVAQDDLQMRQTAIDSMLKPVAEQLKRVDEKIHQLEAKRASAYSELFTTIQHVQKTHDALQAETSVLVGALRQPKARGRWGEMQLRRVAELTGMQEHCDFDMEVAVDSEESRQRPDMVVHLPGGKNIVVDAKTPIDAYVGYSQCLDEKLKEELLEKHAGNVRAQIKLLGQKKYFESFQPSPEFVVLFLPGEMYFSAALEKDPSLLETALKSRVILATPTTFIALLKAIHFGWRQETLEKNALEISTLGRELYDRIWKVSEHFANLGGSINEAVKHYNQLLGSLESRVFVTARRFKELGAGVEGKELKDAPNRDQSARLSIALGSAAVPDEALNHGNSSESAANAPS